MSRIWIEIGVFANCYLLVRVLIIRSQMGQLSRRDVAESEATSGVSNVSAGCRSTTAGCDGSTNTDPENDSVIDACRDGCLEFGLRGARLASGDALLEYLFGIHTQLPGQSSAALSRCSSAIESAMASGDSFTTNQRETAKLLYIRMRNLLIQENKCINVHRSWSRFTGESGGVSGGSSNPRE